MKTLLHTADGKQYSNDYISIFASARNLLDDQIMSAVEFLRHSKEIKHECTLAYLVVIANYITAYNELSQLSFFVHTKHFYK